jgi:MiaB-like tRNA modifying enzyme
MSKQKTVYIESYGCPSNKFDLEIILAYLHKLGYQLVDVPDCADLFVINTCGVKKPTEDRILSRLNFLNSVDKPLIISGCLPKINLQGIIKAVPNFSAVIDPHSIDQLTKAVKYIENGKRNLVFFSDDPKIKPQMPRFRMSKVIDIMQISDGCLGSCTFCCTRFARGNLFSYPLQVIVNQVNSAVRNGIKEVWLTSQDTGVYGKDTNSSLAELLKDICRIEGFFRIRVGMMNPFHIQDKIDELIDAYKDNKVFKFLHLPLQSANDKVLRCMNRFYTVKDFKKIIDAFRKDIPKITLATDIICGFPNEDERAFQDSLRFIAEVKPDVVNVSKFFPRPRTPAAKMKQLPTQIVKMRSKKMSKMVKEISHKQNQKWLHWTGEILIDEKGRNRSWIGRNFAYKPIVVHCETDLWGKRVNICVEQVFPTYLEGTIIN